MRMAAAGARGPLHAAESGREVPLDGAERSLMATAELRFRARPGAPRGLPAGPAGRPAAPPPFDKHFPFP